MESPTLARVCDRPYAKQSKTIKTSTLQVHDETMVQSMVRLVSGRLLGGTCVCLVVRSVMDSDRRREERLSCKRELYRPRMAREMPEEREARLIRWRDYMRRRRANKHQKQLQVEPEAEL